MTMTTQEEGLKGGGQVGDATREKKRDMQVDRDERGSGITGDDY